jgi:hypothetical protein
LAEIAKRRFFPPDLGQKKIFPSVASEGRGRNLDESPAKIVAHMLKWFPIIEGREGRRWDDEEGGTSDE